MISEQSQPKIQEQQGQKQQKDQDQDRMYENKQRSAYFIAKTGHWTYEEKVKYLVFIQYNSKYLEYNTKDQEIRVFKHMSGFIRSRRSHQCRYHHNKMNSYFGTIHQIIAYYQEHIPLQLINQEKYQKDLEKFALTKLPVSTTLEECLLNKEENTEQKNQRKNQKKRTSIMVEEEKQKIQASQKGLLKTQETIKTQSLVDSYKQTFSNILSQTEKIKQQQYKQGQIADDNSQVHLQNIFQINIQSAKTLQKHIQWLQCKDLYEIWKSKVEFLLQPQK